MSMLNKNSPFGLSMFCELTLWVDYKFREIKKPDIVIPSFDAFCQPCFFRFQF